MSTSMRSLHSGKQAGSVVIAVLLMLNPICGNAMASAPALPVAGLDGVVSPISDGELAEMRGKFISPDAVSFFGISMVTSWQDQSGITTTARLALNVDFLNHEGGNPVTQFLIGWTRDGDPAMDIADTHQGYVPVMIASDVNAIGGLGTTAGAAQANIIAASDNKAHNVLEIALVPRSALPALPAGNGLTSANGTTDVGFADGDSLEFRMDQNQVGLVLTGGNGIDSSMQAVGRDMGQVLQQTILNSAHNDVLNSMRIVFGTQASSGGAADPVRLTEALASMRGNGF